MQNIINEFTTKLVGKVSDDDLNIFLKQNNYFFKGRDMQRIIEPPLLPSYERPIDYHCFIDRVDMSYNCTSKRIDNHDELVRRSYMKLGKLVDF